MKYILMMSISKSGYDTFGQWSDKDIQANIAFVVALNTELRESAEFVGAEGLALPHNAVLVSAGADGAAVTDGVFPESKEFLAGYLIIDVESPERAYEIAARWSGSPGPGGAPLNAAIEVRPIMSGKPDEMP